MVTQPNRVAEHARELVASGEVVELEDGRMTTREIRNMEQAVQARVSEMAAGTGAGVSEQDRTAAVREVAERIGGPLSAEQQQALEVLRRRRRPHDHRGVRVLRLDRRL